MPRAEPVPGVCVFAPSPLLTVTIEGGSDDDGPEIHIHAGGQGVWIARMAATLGARVRLAGAFGPEAGEVLVRLIEQAGAAVAVTPTAHDNGVYVHDRRAGGREELAETGIRPLSRHEVDDLFTSILGECLSADVAILGGTHTPDMLPEDFFTRLAADLRAIDKPVVADLSGDALTTAVAGGLTVLKVSHEELQRDGRADGDDVADLEKAMRRLHDDGVDHVVVSRAEDPALLLSEGTLTRIVAPSLREVDHRGAGDSMTAGIGVGLARGLSVVDAVRLGAAAGAQNVTRRGLATGGRELIERLADLVVAEPVERDRPGAGHRKGDR